jgi:hypothetical protein
LQSATATVTVDGNACPPSVGAASFSQSASTEFQIGSDVYPPASATKVAFDNVVLMGQ